MRHLQRPQPSTNPYCAPTSCPPFGDQHLNAITRNDVKAFARDLTVETLTAQRSRLTIAVDFEGHGIGKLLVPLVVRREARKEMPTNLATLKQRPERR